MTRLTILAGVGLAGVGAVVLLAAGVLLKIDISTTKVSDAEDCANAAVLISTDPAKAVAVCRRQADQGNAIAQTALGKMYADGRGVTQIYAEAKRWFTLAADQGQSDAQYNLGLMYADGQGVAQDFAKAVRWYRLAAEQGQPDAQNSLGLRYKRGEGVEQDYVQAHKWFALSAANATAPADRARAVANRDKVAALMSPAQIAAAEKLAREWKPTMP